MWVFAATRTSDVDNQLGYRVSGYRVSNEAPVSSVNVVKAKAEKSYTPPCREKTRAITGHFAPDVLDALHELLKERARGLGHKITVQDSLAEALRDYFVKYKKKIPDGLTL